MPDADNPETELREEIDPRVFSTNPDAPGEGRTFVWVSTGWFERIEVDSGAVEFSPLSMDEHALRRWLSEQGLEITELDDEFCKMARDEFLNDNPSYVQALELSDEEFEARL